VEANLDQIYSEAQRELQEAGADARLIQALSVKYLGRQG
jgi:hypothetical protein